MVQVVAHCAKGIVLAIFFVVAAASVCYCTLRNACALRFSYYRQQSLVKPLQPLVLLLMSLACVIRWVTVAAGSSNRSTLVAASGVGTAGT